MGKEQARWVERLIEISVAVVPVPVAVLMMLAQHIEYDRTIRARSVGAYWAASIMILWLPILKKEWWGNRHNGHWTWAALVQPFRSQFVSPMLRYVALWYVWSGLSVVPLLAHREGVLGFWVAMGVPVALLVPVVLVGLRTRRRLHSVWAAAEAAARSGHAGSR